MNKEELNNFFEGSISKFSNITGIDIIYFVDNDYQIIKEQKINNTDNYFQQILNIVKLETLIDKTGTSVYEKPFHVLTPRGN